MNDHGIGSWPARRARMAPQRRALVQDGVTVTYGELDLLVARVAHGLRAAGVRRGDRVAFLGLNSVELVVTLFATARLGAVFLPLNTRLAAPELAFILEDSEPALLVWAAGFDDVVRSPDVTALGIDERRIEVSGGQGLAALLADDVTPFDEPVGLEDLFMVQYTSGTSGRPKGVMLTHGNITWNVYNLLVDVDLHSDEVALVTAPLFHTAALNQVLLPTLLKGGVALVEAKFDPERVLRLVEEERVTLLFGVTSMYLALAQQPGWEKADLSSLRSALSGGAPIPAALLETWRDRGVGIIQGYGLTEASPGTTMLRASDGPAKLGSAGTACFFTDVRLAGPALEEVPAGGAGEILVSGPNVSPGYWRNEQATRSARVDDHWLRTGDLGVLDEDGFLYVVDRVKDMIISGGENIYPAEVEQALYSHPDVAEAAVIGVPDGRWGEVGRAVVVLRPGAGLTADALLAHLEGRLARYKIPKSVVFVEELPHNASGKLVKSKVRELHGAPAEGVVHP
jgi:fatty-acyl-CoA synthase